MKGFTLLEVAVAMAIVGLGVVTLLEIFSLGLRLTARSSERTETVRHAREVMDEVWPRREFRDGREDGSLGSGHRWTLRVARVEEESALLSNLWELKEVTLRMGAPDRQGWYFEMKTLRLVRKSVE